MKHGNMKKKKGGIFMPGKNFIRIPSILMIAGGAVSVVVYLVFDVLLACGTLKEGESLGWLVVALAAVYTIFALLQFIAAAKGIKGCDRKEAAEDLKKWGVILLIISIIAGLFNCYASVSQGASVVSGVISAVFSLVLPVLYLYGASLNEKA